MSAVRQFAFRRIHPESGAAVETISISASSAAAAFNKGMQAQAKWRSTSLFWELEEFPITPSPTQTRDTVENI